MDDFYFFALVGFGAQLIDGALGMGFGIISSTVLLASGVPPAVVTASTHSAKSFTNAAAGMSHYLAKNVDFALFLRLTLTGVAGGIAGVFVVSYVHADVLRPIIAVYLFLMGAYIIWRAFRSDASATDYSMSAAAPAGLIAGFLDSVGGGGWGPVATSTLVGRGGAPRYVIGTVTLAEFFVSIVVVAILLLQGKAGDIDVMGGLVLGGLVAAPLAGWSIRFLPARGLMAGVGVLVIAISSLMLIRLLGFV
ncbi:MAG: sulfite exporter TauE/SafE family protein [Alphaproteobacteria bacterium]|nr:sulfite exporter TauE/SafE family protein [Alphaproteobacteria bacterium]